MEVVAFDFRGGLAKLHLHVERLAVGGPATIEAGVGDNEVFVVDSAFGGDLTVDAGSGGDLLRLERISVAGDTKIDAGVGANRVERTDAVFSGGLRWRAARRRTCCGCCGRW
jgi:hypothetical protein